MPDKTINDFSSNKEFLSILFQDIKSDLIDENHPLINHNWLDKNTESYRLISIIPKDSEIQLLELHFELCRYANDICFEIHPEGNFIEKQRFSKLAQSFVKDFSEYSLINWSVGGKVDKSKLQNKKIVPKKKFNYSFKAQDYYKTKDALKLQLKALYRDFLPTLENYIALKLENKMDKNEINFLKVLNQFKDEEKIYFFSFLDKIVDHLDLKPNDLKINYSIAENRLNFIVGQRYCWNLYNSHDCRYAAISVQKISDNSKNYKGNPPQPFFNKLLDFEKVISNQNDILEATRKEYVGSVKSSYDSNNDYFEKAVFDLDYRKKIMGKKIISDYNLNPDREKKLQKNLNTILYGPPGTGKTYKTKELAVQITNPNFKLSDSDNLEQRKSLVVEYDRLFENGQIVFTTFHQSYSYEDFVEGIKPKTTEDKRVIYDYLPGIFRRICDKAKTNWLEHIKGNNSELNFDDAFQRLQEEWEENEDIEFSLRTEGKEYKIIGFTETSIQFKKSSGGTGHTLSISTLRDAYYGKREIRSTGLGIYYPGILKRLKSYKNNTSEIESHKRMESPNLQNYVIIIDEINRGNVSAIFGELITLLESDKRLGKEEEIILDLPYSKEKFTVPSNVYIIGTMNTADRSVEALDTALRRRFAFEEVMPNPDLLAELDFSDINLSEVLKTINDRIEVLLDRDHTIGHSYFLKITSLEDLKEVFENKIIPLLQEYFYNDYEKIALILGEGFVKRNEAKVKFAEFDAIDVPEETVSYELKSIEDISEAIKALLNK
ncbi:5-methylcytosine-specific restriction enzyme B [Zunongwangia mangrovi]|uniref:5-methylcytosine-specific restriction enzyme B n=1 Tax=Zunongwangia mangrovi TaxID=1334022 RepID=A0A1I1IS70_9FLAO|nr:AAA family ATPase [Zunongwangia mangrovi]SFC39055.1 5-methylcytosine-specific restriction enzyme B [Zunongwangia mangrovi]